MLLQSDNKRQHCSQLLLCYVALRINVYTSTFPPFPLLIYHQLEIGNATNHTKVKRKKRKNRLDGTKLHTFRFAARFNLPIIIGDKKKKYISCVLFYSFLSALAEILIQQEVTIIRG